MAQLIAIYLNDHLAAATGGRELARRTLAANEDEPDFGPFLRRFLAELEEDRQMLRTVMRRLGIGENRLKPLAAFAGERLGRLKTNGSLRSYSPLSRVIELEGLVVGVTGKLALWRSLETTLASDVRLAEFDFAALAERARVQRDGLEERRLAAARLAFGAS